MTLTQEKEQIEEEMSKLEPFSAEWNELDRELMRVKDFLADRNM